MAFASTPDFVASAPQTEATMRKTKSGALLSLAPHPALAGGEKGVASRPTKIMGRGYLLFQAQPRNK